MIMKKTNQTMKCLVMAFISIFLLASCATLFTKTKYPVMVGSNPDGAKVVITDKNGREVYSGSTPARLELKSSSGFFSKAEYQVKISLPGHDDKIVSISSKIKGLFFLNLTNMTGLIIDAATGAMWKLETEHIDVMLTPSMQTSELIIMERKDIPKEWEKYLVAIDN